MPDVNLLFQELAIADRKPRNQLELEWELRKKNRVSHYFRAGSDEAICGLKVPGRAHLTQDQLHHMSKCDACLQVLSTFKDEHVDHSFLR